MLAYAHFDVAENDGTCYPQVSAHGRYRRHAVTVLLVCRSSKVFHWRCASSLTSRGVGAETAAMSKPYLAALCALPWAMSACGAASWMLPVGAALPSAYWFWTRIWEAKISGFEKPCSSGGAHFRLLRKNQVQQLVVLG